MALAEAWRNSDSRVQFAVSAQRSGFETQAPAPMPSEKEQTIAAEQGEELLLQGNTQLDDLPDEVLCKILEHSGRLEKCFLAQTSSRFLRLASQDYLWATEPAKSSFLRSLALCMSSVLHLPYQVIPVILDTGRSQRFVIRCPLHPIRFLKAARDVEELASETSAQLQDAVAQYKKVDRDSLDAASKLAPIRLIAVTRSDRGSVRIALDPGPAALQAACSLRKLGWPGRQRSSKSAAPQSPTIFGSLFRAMNAYLQSDIFVALTAIRRAATPLFKRRLEGLAEFAAVIAPSACTWSAFDAECHRLLLQLPLQHGMPLQSVLTLLSQQEELLELLASMDDPRDLRDQHRFDTRWHQQTFLTLMALNFEISAAQGLWGAIAGSASNTRSDWAQATDMIQAPPTPQHKAWLCSLGLGHACKSGCQGMNSIKMAERDALTAVAAVPQQVLHGSSSSNVSDAPHAPSGACILLSQCLLKLQAVQIVSWYFEHLWGAF